MTGFSVDWLDLREAADQRARDNKLLQQAGDWVATNNPLEAEVTLVDLGAGTGSTLRAFATIAENSSSQFLSWRLVDLDTSLLAEARLRHKSSLRLQTYALDLTDIDSLPLKGARLVTASALFDLVSANFLDELADALKRSCKQHPVGLYAALNYDGTIRWTPGHPLDDAVLSVFNKDQQQDKGFGMALGPGSGLYMEQLFNQSSFQVFSAKSPWILDRVDNQLVDALINGIGEAVAQHSLLEAASLQDWLEFRKSQLFTGTCLVGHTDLLALPRDRADR